MIYQNLHGILATRADGLIGDGDKIPWHHSGDLKHFKKTTEGAALIMGVKTLVGIAKNYFKNGKEVLPGRRIYVSFHPRTNSFPPDVTYNLDKTLKAAGNFNWKNVFYMAESANVKFDLNCVTANEGKGHVFIAGGAKTYDRYLPYAQDIYMTLIMQKERPEYHHPVYLSDQVQHALFKRDVGISLIKPSENEGDTVADFYKISRLAYEAGIGDGFSEF